MQYQAKTKQLLGSFRTIVDADLLASLEQRKLYGNSTRSDTREQFCHGNTEEGREDHWLTITAYRPEELVDGTPCLVRTLKKSRRGSWLYKIILIPNAYMLELEPFQFQEPEDFWQEAYWQYVQAPVPASTA